MNKHDFVIRAVGTDAGAAITAVVLLITNEKRKLGEYLSEKNREFLRADLAVNNHVIRDPLRGSLRRQILLIAMHFLLNVNRAIAILRLLFLCNFLFFFQDTLIQLNY